MTTRFIATAAPHPHRRRHGHGGGSTVRDRSVRSGARDPSPGAGDAGNDVIQELIAGRTRPTPATAALESLHRVVAFAQLLDHRPEQRLTRWADSYLPIFRCFLDHVGRNPPSYPLPHVGNRAGLGLRRCVQNSSSRHSLEYLLLILSSSCAISHNVS